MSVVEDTSKGDMLLKTGQMAVRVMRDFQVYDELHWLHTVSPPSHTQRDSWTSP